MNLNFGGFEYVILEFMLLPILIPIIIILFSGWYLYKSSINDNINPKKCKIAGIVLVSMIILLIIISIISDFFEEIVITRPGLTILYFIINFTIALLIHLANKQFNNKVEDNPDNNKEN